MKILLAVPLLLLLGVALADEEQISTRTCTNGHCIECLNGVCREARAEASEEQAGSSSERSPAPHNYTHPFCTMTGCWWCEDPEGTICEYIPKPMPIFDPKNCNMTTCWHCMGMGKCSMTNEPGEKPCCFYYPRPFWGLSNNNNNNNSAIVNNNEVIPSNCNATGCWRCTGFGRCSMNDEPGLDPCCSFVGFHKDDSALAFKCDIVNGKKSCYAFASPPHSTLDCNFTNGVPSCISIPAKELIPAGYPFCIMTGCYYCSDPKGQNNCHWHPFHKVKREASEEKSGSSSTNCNSINGVRTCTICENGHCYTETLTHVKREANDGPSNCNETTCWHCMGLSTDGVPCTHTGEPGKKPCCIYHPRPLGQLGGSNSNCNATGCTYCMGLGRCSNTGEPWLPPCCKFYPYRVKREVNRNSVTSRNCDNNGCHICENGNCRYEASQRGKRQGGPMTFTPKSDTCETIEQSKCRCEEAQEKCTRCSETDPNFCVYFDKGVELSGQGKREAAEYSCNPGYPTCRVCYNGFCRTTTNGTHGKREAGVQSTTKNCFNGHCIECVNGQCHDTRNHKREQNGSSSISCINGRCIKCVNGSCTNFSA